MSGGTEKRRPRIWIGTTTFRKNGTPVLGSLGASARRVVIIPTDTWTQLLEEVPALKTTAFEVGELDG